MKRLLRLFVWCLAIALAGCAIGNNPVNHQFSIDGWNDGWAQDIDLLAYEYGNKLKVVSQRVAPGRESLSVQTGVNGPMPIGDYLYVQWRLKKTNEVLEDRVDLKELLPSNMKDMNLMFSINGRQLLVFLVTPESIASDVHPLKFSIASRHYLTYQIYPIDPSKRSK